MDESKFIKIAVSTWIVGVAVALILLLNDYSAFARARESGLTDWTTRIDALDGVFRESLRVESSLKLDYATDEGDITAFNNELTFFSGVVSDYRADYANGGTNAFPDILKQVDGIEKNLDRLQGKLSALTSMTKSMLDNYRQANDYRNQARLMRSEARRFDSAWNWGASYDLLSTAEALDREARYYEENAARVQSNIGTKRSEIRNEVSDVRRKLAEARSECEKAAEQTYGQYLKAKAARFGKDDTKPAYTDNTGRAKYMRKRLR